MGKRLRRITIAVAFILLASCAILPAYFSGAWVPNYPSQTNYPVRGIDVSRH